MKSHHIVRFGATTLTLLLIALLIGPTTGVRAQDGGPPSDSAAASQPAAPADALGAAFTYQGRLNARRNPAHGPHDFQFPHSEPTRAVLTNRPRLRRNPLLRGDCFSDRSLLDGEFAEFFLRPLKDDRDMRWAAGEFGRNFDLGLLGGLAELHARITVPVQLVWGADDPFFPVERTREMLAGFGGPANLHVVERGKLFVHEELPREVADALRPALAG